MEAVGRVGGVLADPRGIELAAAVTGPWTPHQAAAGRAVACGSQGPQAPDRDEDRRSGDTGLTGYTQLVEDAARPVPVRFAAALMLRSRSAAQFRRTRPRAVAEVLAAALQRDLVGHAYPWGRLWAGGDPLGLLGSMVVELGRPAIPPLVALLDDAAPRDTYLGSDEATEIAMRQYRVKDFAAFYLARIAGVALPWQPELAGRDQAIAHLRQQLTAASAVP